MNVHGHMCMLHANTKCEQKVLGLVFGVARQKMVCMLLVNSSRLVQVALWKGMPLNHIGVCGLTMITINWKGK